MSNTLFHEKASADFISETYTTAVARDQKASLRWFVKGECIRDIAAALHVSYDAVRVWRRQWQQAGSAAVCSHASPGAKPRLSPKQLQQLGEALLLGPAHWGYRTELWTLARITAHQATVRCRVPSQPRLQSAAWHGLELPKARARSQRARCRGDHPLAGGRLAAPKKGAQANGATVIFIDETGFSQKPNVRRTWGPQGQTPVFKEHFNWQRLSAVGAIAWRPGEATTRLFLSPQPGSIKTPQVVEFLRNLRRHVRGPVLIVWDRLRAHCSTVTAAHVAAQSRWLQVEYLPAYAPELNPLEYLWATFKGKDMANYSPDSIDELDHRLRCSVRRVRRRDLGLSFIKKAGLISKEEYLELCKGQ